MRFDCPRVGRGLGRAGSGAAGVLDDGCDIRGSRRVLATVGAVFMVDEARFEQLVADALDTLPPALGEMMDNVAKIVS